MRAVQAAWLAAWLAAAVAAQDAPPAFVEVELPAGPVWAGQRIAVVVRVGYDDAFFRASGVPLFQRPRELPFQLVVPWSDERADRSVQLVDSAPADGRRLVVGDGELVVRRAGQRERGGRTFELLELRCHWTALLAGEHAVEPVVLRYAYATRFEESLLGGRQPVDRHDESVASAPQRLAVRALPADAPADFTGAVGLFAAQATAVPAEVELGATFTLQLEVTGDGDLLGFPAPPWPELPGFVVQGLVEPRDAGSRRFLFDVLALRPAAEIGPLGFTFFDPVAGEYRTARTAPVPLRVLPLPPGREVSPRVQALLDADADALAQANGGPWPYRAAWLTALLLVFFGARRHRLRRRRRAAHERAVAGLEERLQAGPDAACAGFEACCAVWSGAADASRLAAAGVPEPLVARANALHAALAAARYGGKPPPADEVLDVARQIVAALR